MWKSRIEADHIWLLLILNCSKLSWGHLVQIKNYEIQNFQNATPSAFCYEAPANKHFVVFTSTSQKYTLHIKLLAVTIDECLNWKLHADQVASKMSKSLVVIRGMRQVLFPDDMKKLHYALIYPHFTYGIVVWGKASKLFIGRIKKMPLFQKLHILKFQDTLKRMRLYFHNNVT